MTPSSRTLGFGAAVLAIVLSGHPVTAQKQVVPPANIPAGGPAISLPVDRKTTQLLTVAGDLIAEKMWKEATTVLQKLLDSREDSFAEVTRVGPDGKTITRLVSARSEAARLLQTLPEAGQKEYQKEFGDVAATRLAQAKQLADPALLADVVQRYFSTASGPEAATLLAMHYLSHDEPLLASLYFDRLFQRVPAEQSPPLMLYRAAMAFTRAGDKQRGEALWLLAAGKLQKEGGLKIGEKFLPLKTLREELDRAGQGNPVGEKPVGENLVGEKPVGKQPAADWPNFRGGPSRTDQGAGGAPFLESTWSRTTLNETKAEVKNWTENNLNRSIQWLDQRGLPVLSAFFPIAVKGKVVYRNYDGVYALDLRKEGKLEWFSETDGGVFTLLADPNKKAILEQWNQMYLQTGQSGILFENSVTGTLSTDGTRVFVVDDLAVLPHPAFIRNFAFGGQPNFGTLNDQINGSSLKAYNLESGKLVWELGGKFDKDDAARGFKASELAGSIILAPPLPLGGRLYVLFERNQEIRLACIEPRDKPVGLPDPPKVPWVQTIALTKDKIALDVVRRTQAAHLAYGNGVLVCPTNAGAVVGVDLLTHRLLWAHSYAAPAAANPAPVVPGRFGAMQMQVNLNPEWRIAAPAIADGKVVFAPPDAGTIHCLDIRDGSLIWKAARGADDLYFAGIVGGKALIVGKNSIKALDRANGKLAWEIANVGTPSGQGVASEGVYYLPLKAGPDKEPEVCAVSVAQGKVVARTKSRKKEYPGNLIFYDGEVISQTVNAISGYPTIKAKLNQIDERLKQNANDPAGLVERAELRLDKGDLAGALADLQTAIKNKPAADLLPKARAKLYETLTELLQRDFAAGEKHLDEYRAICQADDPAERKRREQTYLVVLAKGRESQGRLTDALAAYLDFAGASGSEPIALIDEPNTKARPDVWTRGRVAGLFARATPEQRKVLEEQVTERYKAVVGKNDIESLRSFAAIFDNASATGRQARLQLARQLMAKAKDDKADELRETQLHLLQLRIAREADPTAAGQAVELLGKLMVQKGLLVDAASYYKELGRDFGKVIIRDNKTGADILNEIKTDKRFQPFLEGTQSSWEGKFKVEETAGNFPMMPSFTLEPVGDPGASAQSLRIALDAAMQQIRVSDKATGEQRWKSSMLTAPNLLTNVPLNSVRLRCQVQGSVMTATLGWIVYGFDLIDGKKLWEYNLYQPGTNQNTALIGQILTDRDGTLRLLYHDGWVQKLGQGGPMSPGSLIVQTRQSVTALDALTGGVLWTRTDVSSRTQIFGDSQYIFLAEMHPDEKAALSIRALRVSDGVGVTVPDFSQPFQDRVKIVGRSLLVREETNKGVRLRLFDPLTGKDSWSSEFPANSRVLNSEDDLAGVIEPDGTFSVVDLRDRKELLKTAIKKELLEKVNEAHLLTDREQFYVVLNRPADGEATNGVWPQVSQGMRSLSVNGNVLCISRDGKFKWANEVERQMLVREQFADLPMLLFAARTTEWGFQGNNRIVQQAVKVKSMHKGTGKLLFDKQLTGNAQQFHSLQIDPRAGAVDLISFNLKIRHMLEK